MNLFIVYKLDTRSRNLKTKFTLGDPDKYGYSDYGIGFDARSDFFNK